MIKPQDTDAAILEMAKAIDVLSGRLAALTAFIAYTSQPLDENSVITVQGTAQSLCPPAVAPPTSGGPPKLHASQGVTKIQSVVESFQAIRSAGHPSPST